MARRGRTAVLKRQRERKKAEKAEMKRAQRLERREAPSDGGVVAEQEDLAALGLVPEPEESEEDS